MGGQNTRSKSSPRLALVTLVAAALFAAACGVESVTPSASASADVDRVVVSPDQAGLGAGALSNFGWDLYRQLAEPEKNLVFSPHSIGVALAMTRAGALGETQQAMDSVLHVPPGADIGPSLNALDAAFAAAAGTREQADGSTADLVVDVTNALWAQNGFGFEEPFLTSLAEDFGAGVQLVDYQSDVEGARQQINDWVADEPGIGSQN